jgi:peptidoglycan/LPS O-acetylase OafA/YrhL
MADTKQTHEMAGIEALRFACGFAVLIWHYQDFFFFGAVEAEKIAELRNNFPLSSILHIPFYYGNWAVELFWTISGFIFYWRYADLIRGRRVGSADFAVRRFSRLYPLHIVTLFLAAIGQYLYFGTHGYNFINTENSIGAFIAQLFFASNWFPSQPQTFNSPIWSVSAEIPVYFAFFWAVRAFGNSALLAIALCALCWVVTKIPNAGPSLIVTCAMYFFAGGAAQRLSKLPYTIPISAGIVILCLALITFGFWSVNGKSIFLLSVFAVVFMARAGETHAGSFLRHISFLGSATYSSYLLHFPLQIGIVIVVDALGYARSIFFSPVALIAYLATVIALSFAIYRWFEMPAQNWLRKASARVSARQPALLTERP